MTIEFEDFDTIYATMHLHRQQRVLLSDRTSVFRLRRQPLVHIEASTMDFSVMSVRHPQPRVRLTDRNDVFLLHRKKQITIGDGGPVPSASVFLLNRPQRHISMSIKVTDFSVTDVHRQPRVLLTDAIARFVLHRQPHVFIYDGVPNSDRTAYLIQQPVLMASMTKGLMMQLADQFDASSHPDADWIHALLDLFTVNSRYSQAAQVLQALADGVSLADIAQMIIQSDLLDSFIASGVLAGTAQVTVLLADGFDADDGAGALAEILAALRDGFYATITLNTGDDVFTAWVMTTQTKAMRSYSNWAFNSYATLGGQFIGAGKNGIYRMGGSTDAGDAIRWAIRTGKLDFGTMQMKGAPLVYVGATTSGDLLLKVTATTVRGQMAEQIYRLTPAVTGEPREHRLKVGRGFRSVYWTFELTNDTDGATAEVHEWHAVPVKHTGKLI